LVSSVDAGGSYTTMEITVPPGEGANPHSHSAEEEQFYVLEGDLNFEVGGDELDLKPIRSALINVDLQQCFVDGAADGLAVVETVNRLSATCRAARMLVVHTRHVLRADGSNMGRLATIPKIRDGLLTEGADTASFHPGLVIAETDVELDKPRFGAFHGTDLELILRSRDIDTIIISGISTPICCDTTAREERACLLDGGLHVPLFLVLTRMCFAAASTHPILAEIGDETKLPCASLGMSPELTPSGLRSVAMRVQQADHWQFHSVGTRGSSRSRRVWPSQGSPTG
jgi:ureidoacrylate peracid hydrolase